MATKWYLRASTANVSPSSLPSGEQSSTQPVAAQQYGLSPTTRDLLGTKGSSATSEVVTIVNTSSVQNGCHGRWVSSGRKAGTYGSGSWSLAVQVLESNSNADLRFVDASIYFWRPSTASVVGFVADANTIIGAEWATTRTGQVVTITGSNVTIQDGDVLVFELWATRAAAGMNGAYTGTVYFDGATDVTAGYTGTDPASYLSAPADIPDAPAVAVWSGSAATVSVSAAAGGWTPGPKVWSGSAGSVQVAAAGGSFASISTWSGSAAAVVVAADGGGWSAGAVSWAGGVVSVAVVASAGGFTAGGVVWSGGPVGVVVSAEAGMFDPGPVSWPAAGPVTVVVVAAAGQWTAGGVEWVSTPATVVVAMASGVWVPAGVSWPGTVAALEVTAGSTGWVGVTDWPGGTVVLEVVAIAGMFAAVARVAGPILRWMEPAGRSAGEPAGGRWAETRSELAARDPAPHTWREPRRTT